MCKCDCCNSCDETLEDKDDGTSAIMVGISTESVNGIEDNYVVSVRVESASDFIQLFMSPDEALMYSKMFSDAANFIFEKEASL